MNDYIKYPLILCIVTVFCTVLVTFTYIYTTPILAARQNEVVESTLNGMYDNIDTYQKVERKFDGEAVTGIYDVLLDDGSQLYVYQAAATGKNGDVEMLVSVLPSGEFDAVKYVRMQETVGIGTKVTTDEYVASLVSQTTNEVEVDMITGATMTSTAVSTIMDDVAKDFNMNFGGN